MKNVKLEKKLIVASSVFAAIIGLALSVNAETNIPEKVVQLKENVDASRENLKQYEDNSKVVDLNIKETQVAIKQLEKQKLAIKKQLDESQKGKVTVENSKKQLQAYMRTEQEKLDNEKRQIEDLKLTIMKLEVNQAKRTQNITTYQTKLQSVETDQNSWQNHQQEVIELSTALQDKVVQAQKDLKSLNEKKMSYDQEIAKWKKQQRLSERNYANFKDLKEE